MSRLLITQATMVGRSSKSDCLIVDGKIAAIENSIKDNDAQVIHAAGQTLIPGMIDVHTHLRVPGNPEKEDWVSGGAAAIAGGVTTIFTMPNTNPPITSAVEVGVQTESIERHLPIFGQTYIAATAENLSEIMKSRDYVCGVKVYYGSTTGAHSMQDESALRALFESDFPGVIVIHAENDEVIAQHARALANYTGIDKHSRVRDREAAITAIEKIIALVHETGATNVHITHITTRDELDRIREARAAGAQITCDVTPHHLAFTTADYERLGQLLRVNPPIRTQDDVDALWEGVRDGSIDMVASDHAPHLLAEKMGDVDSVPSGVPGLETTLLFLLDRVGKGFSLERVVQLTSGAPAKRFGLRERGRLEPGTIADLVLVDTKGKTRITNDTIKSKSGWSPWNGDTFQVKITTVIVRGQKIYDL